MIIRILLILLLAAPAFAAEGNFRLQLGSPAINAGTDVGLTTDILGLAIVGLPDLGAYEFYSGRTMQGVSTLGISVH